MFKYINTYASERKKKRENSFFLFLLDVKLPENISVLVGPTSGSAVTLKTGRLEVPGSNPGRACRPSRSEFSVVFSETRVNTG